MTDHGELTTLSLEKHSVVASPPLSLLSAPNKASAFLDLLGRALIILALPPLLLGGWSALHQYWRASTWERTDARITNAEVYSGTYSLDPHGQGPRTKYYGYRCTLSFVASGSARESKLDLGGMSPSREALAKWIGRFPEGSRIAIVYKPSDPSQVQLDNDQEHPTVDHGALELLRLAFWLLLGGIPMRLIAKSSRMSEVDEPREAS